MSDLTRADMLEVKDDILDRVSGGFARTDATLGSINNHLATLNGRVGRLETTDATLDLRLKGVERYIGGGPDLTVETPTKKTGKRDWGFVGVGSALGAMVAEFLRRLLT